MAFVGLPYYGFCPYAVTQNDDGSETESYGIGKLTKSVIGFDAANANKNAELWAGDRMEQNGKGSPTANVTLERSYLSLEEEAAICGHAYNDGDLVENEDDQAAYLICAKMSKLVTPDRKTVYRVEVYHRVQFDPVDSKHKTATGNVAYTTVSLSGKASVNCNGDFRFAHDYQATEKTQALNKMKELLHMQVETPEAGEDA